MLTFNALRAAVLAATLALLSLAGSAAPARAQQILASKDICGPALGNPTACVLGNGASPVVAPNTAVSYQITLANTGSSPANVDFADSLPAGFVPTGTTCGSPLPGGFYGPVAVPGNAQTVCVITGYFNYLPASFNNANNAVTVYSSGDREHPLTVSNQVNAVVAPPSTIPSDVSVTKIATVLSSGNGWTVVHYTITVTNGGPNDVYGLQLQDRMTLPATSIPLTVTYQGNGNCATWVTSSNLTIPGVSPCFDPIPSTIHSPLFVPSTSPVDFAEWSYPGVGFLKAGEQMVIEFDVRIEVPVGMACQLFISGNQLINEAHIGFNIPGATTTTFEAAPGNNTDTAVASVDFTAPIDPNCGQPALQITKALDPTSPAQFNWGDTVTYVITLHNASTLPLTNVHLFDTANGALGDFVSGGIGTPAFTAQVVAINCPLCTSTTPGGGWLPQTVAGYLNPYWMLGTDVTTTLTAAGTPGDTVTFTLQIKYGSPQCDSYPEIAQKPVINFIRAKYSDPTLGGNDVTVQSNDAIALFADVQDCDFKVTKDLANGDPAKVVFGQNVHYTVTYQNLDNQPMTIGTMIDGLAIDTSAYAWPLTVHYDYICTESGGVTGFPFGTPQSGVVQVAPTSLPQQGVRIIQNLTPVTFPGNSIVTCDIRIMVDAPVGASQCARLGNLVNAAVMDQSAFYQANLPWNTTPGFYDMVSLPLPACFDLVVNKAVNPIWTTPGGGPFGYNLMVANHGDPVIPADGVSVSDNFTTAANLASSSGVLCTDPGSASSAPVPSSPGPTDCDTAWTIPPTASNPSALDVPALSTGWSAHGLFQIPGPFAPPPSEVCNSAEVTVMGGKASDPLSHPDWYARDPSTWKTQRCAGVFDQSEIKIVKIVDLGANTPPPPPTAFLVNVICTYAFNGTPYNSSQTLTLNWPSPAGAVTQPVPLGSSCSIVEQQPSATLIAEEKCPSGFGQWSTNVLYPDSTTVSPALPGLVTIYPAQSYAIHNSFACADIPPLSVIKKVSNPQNLNVQGAQFPITVACSGDPDINFGIADGQQVDLVSMTPGTGCFVSEDTANIHVPSADEKPLCPKGLTPVWTSHISPAGPVHRGDIVVVGNEIECVNLEPGSLSVGKVLENDTHLDLSQLPFPMTVTCGGLTQTVTPVSGQILTAGAYPNGASCQVVETLPDLSMVPAEKACPERLVPQWQTPSYQPAQQVTINGQTIVVVHNAIKCVEAPLTFIKKIDNRTHLGPGDMAGWTFQLSVVCDGVQTSITLVNGQPVTFAGAAPGGECKYEELTGQLPQPSPDKACPDGWAPQWRDPTYDPSQYVQLGDRPIIVTVLNVLECVKVSVGTVTKKVVNHTQLPASDLADWQFPVQVICEDGTETTFQLANGQSAQVNIGDPSTTCKIDEDLTQVSLPSADKACPAGMVPQWSSYQVGPDYLVAGGEAYIVNVLDCVRPEKPVAGSLTVWKIVDNQTGVDISTLLYDIEVDCGGTITWLHLLNGHSDSVNNIAAGTNCSVTETTPSPVSMPIGNECFVANMVPEWLLPVGYVPASSVQINGQAAAVYVQNTLQCAPAEQGRTGLTIKKTITSDTMDVTGYQNGDFVVQVSCSNPASLTVVTLTHANGYQATLPNLPSGADCTILEDLSQNPGLPAGQQWVATYPSGNQVTIQAGDQVFLFHNEHVWNAVPPGQSELRVSKDFTIHGKLDPNHTMSFQVSVSCTDANGAALSGFNPLQVTLNPNFVGYMDSSVPEANYSAWATYPVPTGSTCTIAEPAQPAPSAGLATCQWAVGGPSYSNFAYGGSEQQGASTTLSVTQQTYELSVLNELNCPPFIVAPEPAPTVRTFTITVTQPEPCTPGKGCGFVVDFANEAGDASAGPLFLSASLPAALGGDVGDWFCANSDMGGLCHTSLEDHASGTPLTLELPLAIPRRAGSDLEACFSVEMPSDANPRSVARAVQLGLASHGYGLGTIDGLIGPRSRAAIASFAKRSGTTLAAGSMDEVYSLLFGEAPLPKTDPSRGNPTCIPIDLVQIAEPVAPAKSPSTDLQPDFPSTETPDELICSPPQVLNRDGTDCICPAHTVAVGDQCLAQDLTPEVPKLELPGGFDMPAP